MTSVGYAHGRRQGGRGCEQPHLWGEIIEIYSGNTHLSKLRKSGIFVKTTPFQIPGDAHDIACPPPENI
jgi:hypothetical protein